jgi:hypothetical protein
MRVLAFSGLLCSQRPFSNSITHQASIMPSHEVMRTKTSHVLMMIERHLHATCQLEPFMAVYEVVPEGSVPVLCSEVRRP